MSYWSDRQSRRLLHSERLGLAAMNKVLPMYDLALRNINKEINSIYVNYANKVGLDVGELSRVLSGADKSNFIKNIQADMRALGFNVSDIYDKNYIARLTRLEALKQQVYWQIQRIAPKEINTTTGAYARIVFDAYNSQREDIRLQMGASSGFSTIDDRGIKEILANQWEGGNYSTRIWTNTSRLSMNLQEVLGAGLTTGISQDKMIRMIQERMDVGKFNATRLIRTETDYFQNQGELQSYRDEGIRFYKFDAVMDNRTSNICEEHDGKVYRVEDATVGENFPPLHPNCRSGTQIVFDNEVKAREVEKAPTPQPKKEDVLNPETTDMFKEIYEANIGGLVSDGWKRNK